jgi:hypothetical protein
MSRRRAHKVVALPIKPIERPTGSEETASIVAMRSKENLLDAVTAAIIAELDLKVRYKEAQRERITLIRRVNRLHQERPAVDETV